MHQNESAVLPEFLTLKEAAKKLRCDRVTVWSLRTRRRDPLPSLRLGGKVLIPADELAQWLSRQRVKRLPR